jgi:RNA polymerase sigma-70 factor, ECF subfamily
MSERRHQLNLAYRLLGSLADAEDAVQETYARWYAISGQQQDAIESPDAWLTAVASRICLNQQASNQPQVLLAGRTDRDRRSAPTRV